MKWTGIAFIHFSKENRKKTQTYLCVQINLLLWCINFETNLEFVQTYSKRGQNLN